MLVAGATATRADRPATERGFSFDAPDDLEPNRSLSIQIARDLAAVRHYDGLKTEVGADAYVGPGLAFYVLWVHATEPTDEPALKVRRTFDDLRQAPVDDTSPVQSAELVSWSEDVDTDLAIGELEWRHLSNETVTRVRATMWVTGSGQLRQLRGECVMRAGQVERLRPRCDELLSALRVTASNRGALGAIPSAGSLELSDVGVGDDMLIVVEDGTDAGASTAPSLRPPTEGAVMYEQPVQSAPDKDHTFLYLGGAVLLIVAVYVLMRRSGGESEPNE